MPKRYWSFILAAGIALSASLGQAQEQAEGSQGQAADNQEPAKTLSFPLRLNVIETEAETNARERREAEARQREKDDLIAQQGMNAATQEINRATQRMSLYSLISTALVGLGTALLIATLWLTRQANRAAQAAVDVTREMGERQVRAYVGFVSIQVTNFAVGAKPIHVIDMKNSGNSPAYKTKISTMMLIGGDDKTKIRFAKGQKYGTIDIAANQPWKFNSVSEIFVEKGLYDAVICHGAQFIFAGVNGGGKTSHAAAQ